MKAIVRAEYRLWSRRGRWFYTLRFYDASRRRVSTEMSHSGTAYLATARSRAVAAAVRRCPVGTSVFRLPPESIVEVLG